MKMGIRYYLIQCGVQSLRAMTVQGYLCRLRQAKDIRPCIGGMLMAINSKAKGKRGEIEIVRMLREYGYDCRRGQQYCGANGDADVVGLPGLHLEIKRVEKLNVENALRQAEADAKAGEIPVVMHRANREEWKVTLRLKDFMEIWKNDGK